MKNWTIRKRIIVVSALLVALLLVISLTADLNLRTIAGEAKAIRDDNVAGLVSCSRITGSLEDSFIRTLLVGRAATEEERAKWLHEQEGFTAITADALAKYEASIFESQDRALFENLKQIRSRYSEARAQYYAAIKAGDPAAAGKILETSLLPAYFDFTKAGQALMEYNNESSTANADLIVRKAEWVNRVIAAVALAAVVAAILLSTVVIRSVNQALRAVTDVLRRSADQVASASAQVSTSSQTLASGASEQAASLEETGASLEEISSMTKRNSENASQANTVTRTTRGTADRGASDMAAMARAMEEIKSSSDEVAKIIKTIDEIAFQTNILALNAAVEAARAGEAGAGFAVVADEVRNLARRAADSAKETSSKIEGAIAKTATGVTISGTVQASLQQIVEQIRSVDALVSEVAQASKEQTEGITQVGTAVRQMDQVTQANAANAEETAAASEELSAQAESLKDVVNDLVRLVGGGSANAAAVVSPPAPRPAGRKATAAAPKAARVAVLPVPARSTRSEVDAFFQ